MIGALDARNLSLSILHMQLYFFPRLSTEKSSAPDVQSEFSDTIAM